jgi:hypothetical protein
MTDRATFAYLCDVYVLYEQFGFTPLARPGSYMEILLPDVYANGRATSSS